MAKQSRTRGIAISYIVTAVRSLSQFFLTALYIRKLGVDGYGFYQYVYSIACYAIVFDFGISSVVNKYVIEFREKNDNNGVENVLFFSLLLTIFSVLTIASIGGLIIYFIPQIFGALSEIKYNLAKKLLLIIIGYISILITEHYFEGVILAFEHYVTLKIVALVQIIIKVIIVLLLLYSNFGIISIAIGDLTAAIVCLIFSIFYAFSILKIKVSYHYFDKRIIQGTIKLSTSICLQSFILYLNTSIDKFALGKILNETAVTIYAVGLHFSNFFDEIPTVIQRLYLPQAVQLTTNGADGEELTDFVIKPGRYQFILCGGMFGAFLLFGKTLITLWSGKETIFAWWISIMFMSASIIPLIQNVSLAILTAKNKRLFRSIVLCLAAVLNLILTIFLVKRVGLIGAPVGTFIALIIGNNLTMNWYYKYKIGLNIQRMFKSIFNGILPVVILTTIVCIPLTFIPLQNIAWLCFECTIYCILYALLLWNYGLNMDEKKQIETVLNKVLKRG